MPSRVLLSNKKESFPEQGGGGGIGGWNRGVESGGGIGGWNRGVGEW